MKNLLLFIILMPTLLFGIDVKEWGNQLIAEGKTKPDWTIDENFSSGLISFGLLGKVVNLDFTTGKVTWSGFTPDVATRLFWDAVVLGIQNINSTWISQNCTDIKFFPSFKGSIDGTERVIVLLKGAKSIAVIGVESGMVKYTGYTPDQAAMVFWACVLNEYPELKARW